MVVPERKSPAAAGPASDERREQGDGREQERAGKRTACHGQRISSGFMVPGMSSRRANAPERA